MLENKTANLVENFWKGKMSGEEWERCRTENQDVWDPILNLSLHNDFAPMRVGASYLAIFELRFPHLHDGRFGLNQRCQIYSMHTVTHNF